MIGMIKNERNHDRGWAYYKIYIKLDDIFKNILNFNFSETFDV